MKGRIIWITIAVALLGLIGYRVAAVRAKRSAPQKQESAEAALVRSARVVRADLAEKVAFTGSIRPRNEVDVFAKVAGRVETVHVQVGDKVKAGQVLAVVEHKEIAWQAKAAQAAVQVARAGLEGAQLEYDRVMALSKGGAAPQSQVDGAKVRLSLAQAQLAQAEAAAGLASQQLANATIVSPIAGTVTRRPINVGAQVGPQSPVATVQDVALLKLEGSVDGGAFARLKRDAPASIAVDQLPGETFAGKVSLMAPSLDAATRRATIEIEVDNAGGRLLPNMFARAEVVVGQLPATLAVPRDAVYEAAGGPMVFRVKDGRAIAVRAELGPVDAGLQAVRTGLSEGDEIAVSGLAGLSDGAPVKTSAAN